MEERFEISNVLKLRVEGKEDKTVHSMHTAGCNEKELYRSCDVDGVQVQVYGSSKKNDCEERLYVVRNAAHGN
jgi:hypothetical protein